MTPIVTQPVHAWVGRGVGGGGGGGARQGAAKNQRSLVTRSLVIMPHTWKTQQRPSSSSIFCTGKARSLERSSREARMKDQSCSTPSGSSGVAVSLKLSQSVRTLMQCTRTCRIWSRTLRLSISGQEQTLHS
eukprot:COSAG01_NODE_8668_length_2703_cov_4.591398_2_plen_132_part_00